MPDASSLLAGYAKADVTPPLGMVILGSYAKKVATGVHDPLHLYCAAFQKDGKTVLLFTCEAIGIWESAYRTIAGMIEERFGIPKEAVFISCMHSHTAFRILPVERAEDDMYRIFLPRLYLAFCDAAKEALEDLSPASLFTAHGECRDVAFLRRYRMKDGSVKMNPPIGSDEIEAFSGEKDEELILVRVKREGKSELLFLNFGTHADVVSGTDYSADFPGYLRTFLQGALEGKAEVLFFNGCEGNSNHINCFQPKGTPRRGHDIARKMARKISAEALRLYDDARPVSSEGIDYVQSPFEVARNAFTEEELAISRRMVEIWHERGHRDPELKTFPFLLPKAVRIVQNLNNPEIFHLHASLIRIGGVVFVGAPGEPFQEIGMEIKEKSPYPDTLVTCCTNGSWGYMPTEDAYRYGAYEDSVSPFASDCAPKFIQAVIFALSELKRRDRKGEQNGNH